MPDPLTQTAVKRLVAAGVPGDYRDARTRGLILRIGGPDRFTWNFRRTWKGKDHRLDLGPQWSLDEARGIVAEVESRLEVDKRQRSRFAWFDGGFFWSDFMAKHARRAARIEDEAPREVERVEKGPRVPYLPWDEAVALWAVELARTKRETTAYNYRMALNVLEMKPFHHRSVASVTRIEAAEAIADMHRRGVETQAKRTAVSVRKLFAFLGEDAMTRRSGVEPERMKLLRAPEDTLVEDDDYEGNGLLVPDGPMVGHLVRALRDGASSFCERDRLAGLLAVYSVQRRRAVALAMKEDFEPATQGGIWKMRPSHRKTASTKRRRGLAVGDHVICLPPPAWAVVQRAIDLADGSPYLFPATRHRRADVEPTSIHPSQLTHMFGDLAGNPIRPHDLRRALATTYANEADLEDNQVKWVLDHAEGVKSGDTTREHYRLTTGEHKKWPVYEGWVAWVDKWAATRD